jgi:hypothetical protein
MIETVGTELIASPESLTPWGRVAFQQLTNFGRRQWPEFENEANAGVHLRIARKALFKACHTGKNHSTSALFKNAPCLLRPVIVTTHTNVLSH